MISLHTTRTPGRVPARAARGRLVASVDVEWTKNYRIANGNVPFCYSITYLHVPRTGPVDLAQLPMQVCSRYVEGPGETVELVRVAAEEIGRALHRADLVVGHQLSSDLAVLAAAGRLHGAGDCLDELARAREAWHARRMHAGPAPVLDTRYDAGHVVTGTTSRRLVDVCTDLGLNVEQPELRGTSMTAVHRRWLEAGDIPARERITTLNLRHSLSAALVALVSTGRAPRPPAPVGVNRMLHDHLEQELPGRLGWLAHPTFTATLTATLTRPLGRTGGRGALA